MDDRAKVARSCLGRDSRRLGDIKAEAEADRRPVSTLRTHADPKFRLRHDPLTSEVARLYPAQALVRVRGRQSKAMADQITMISKLRLRTYAVSMARTSRRSIVRFGPSSRCSGQASRKPPSTTMTLPVM